MKTPAEGPLLCEPQLAPTSVPEFNPLAGLGPDLEYGQLPPSSPAPACLFRRSDRSQHFHNLIEAEIARLETRVIELKMQLTGAGPAAVSEGGD